MFEKEEAVLVLRERQRRRAIENDDLAVLDELLADHFYYAHINGERDNRSTYLERIKSRATNMISTKARDVQIAFRPQYALMQGISRMDFEPSDGSGREVIETLFLSVWEKSGGVWKISAYASTPMQSQYDEEK